VDSHCNAKGAGGMGDKKHFLVQQGFSSKEPLDAYTQHNALGQGDVLKIFSANDDRRMVSPAKEVCGK